MSSILNFIYVLIFSANIQVPNTIYNFNVINLEGGTQSLSAYTGKKILVVTLPISQTATNDSLLYSLDTLATSRSYHLQVVAVPAIEDGYNDSLKNQLLTWYRSHLQGNILISEGVYTRKTSGTQQHPLFQWLTKESQNEIFDIDADAPWFKFITNDSGQLYGVLRPGSKISGNSVQKTLNMQ